MSSQIPLIMFNDFTTNTKLIVKIISMLSMDQFLMFYYYFRSYNSSCILIMATAADVENEQFRTMKDFMKNYNKLSEICFADCIWDFTTR